MSLEKFLKDCNYFETHGYQLGLDQAKKLIRIVREMEVALKKSSCMGGAWESATGDWAVHMWAEDCLKRCDELAGE